MSFITTPSFHNIDRFFNEYNNRINHQETSNRTWRIDNDRKCCYTVQFHCVVCKSNENLMRCSRCKTSFYCSRVCQKKDWKNHKLIRR